MGRLRGFFASRRNRWLASGAILLLAWLAAHLRGQMPQVKVTAAARGALTLTIAASGRVDGPASDLGFTDAGTLAHLYVEEGDRVEAHALLARIDRGSSLLPDTTLPGTDVIEAPFAGSVVQIYRHLGSSIQPGEAVLRLVRSDAAWVTAFLDSDDAAWLKAGDQLTVRSGGYLARPFEMRVEALGGEAVPREDVPGSARQVRLRLRPATTGFNLPVGAAVDVDGEVKMLADALLAPAGAVSKVRGRTYVWVLRGSRVTRVEVVTGPNNFRQIAIERGLSAGERVVVEGKDLKEGQRVRASAWTEAATP